MNNDPDKRTEEETTEAFERAIKTMLTTPPEQKNDDGKSKRKRRTDARDD